MFIHKKILIVQILNTFGSDVKWKKKDNCIGLFIGNNCYVIFELKF